MWTEVERTEIPFGTPVYRSITESGNVKYCFILQGITVPVSKSNAEAFVKRERRLELVKWYNASDRKYKYTTRRLSVPNLDFSTVFQ